MDNLIVGVLGNATMTVSQCIAYANQDFISPHVLFIFCIISALVGFIGGFIYND